MGLSNRVACDYPRRAFRDRQHAVKLVAALLDHVSFAKRHDVGTAKCWSIVGTRVLIKRDL